MSATLHAYLSTSLLLQQYELFHSSKTVQNETIATFLRHHLTNLCCGQLHLSHQQ